MNQQEIDKAIQTWEKQREYAKQYAQRPEVREKRKTYNRNRWNLIKTARKIIAQQAGGE